MTVLGQEYAVVNELVLPYDPTATAARRDRYRRAFFLSLLGLVISVVIAGAFFLIFRWNDPLIWFFYGLFGAVNVVRIIYSLTRWLLARRTLARIPDTRPAVQIDRAGLGIGELGMPWGEVTTLAARTPWWTSAGRLEIRRGTEKSYVRLDQLPALLSTVSSAVTALSEGQRRIDVTRLDR